MGLSTAVAVSHDPVVKRNRTILHIYLLRVRVNSLNRHRNEELSSDATEMEHVIQALIPHNGARSCSWSCYTHV